MSEVLQYAPGAQTTILLQILDATGVRVDGYSTPVVSSVVLPDLTLSGLYPLNMLKISTGLYYHRFTLPTGASAVGTYIVNLSWTDPSNNPKQDYVQVICMASGGQFSVSPG